MKRNIEIALPKELDGDTLEREIATALGLDMTPRGNEDGSYSVPMSVSVATEHTGAGKTKRQFLIVHLLDERPGDEAKIQAVVKAHRGAKS